MAVKNASVYLILQNIRQELDRRMEEVVHEHNQIREVLSAQDTIHPLLSRIEDWGKGSIQEIKNTAKQARTDLKAFLDHTNID